MIIRGQYKAFYDNKNHLSNKDGYVYEHRYIAEKMLGRILKDEETIHHIDEDKMNNSEENLMVFKTVSDHTAYHQGVKAVLDGDVWWCPDKFTFIQHKCKKCETSITGYGKTDMCMKCLRIENRKVNRPSKEQLVKLILTNPFTKIAEMYGVSDKAVAKWCKYYELPYRKKDIKTWKVSSSV